LKLEVGSYFKPSSPVILSRFGLRLTVEDLTENPDPRIREDDKEGFEIGSWI